VRVASRRARIEDVDPRRMNRARPGAPPREELHARLPVAGPAESVRNRCLAPVSFARDEPRLAAVGRDEHGGCAVARVLPFREQRPTIRRDPDGPPDGRRLARLQRADDDDPTRRGPALDCRIRPGTGPPARPEVGAAKALSRRAAGTVGVLSRSRRGALVYRSTAGSEKADNQQPQPAHAASIAKPCNALVTVTGACGAPR